MTNTIQITFRNMESSATAEEWIREEARKLDEFYSHIMGCRVVVELSNRRHRSGNLYHVRIDLTVPGGELVVKREPSLHSSIQQTRKEKVVKHLELQAPHRELRQAIDDAFKTMGRRLQDYARRQRRDVKTHEPTPQAQVSKLFPSDGFGFLETPGGREVYFHENSVLGDGFARLKLGAAVNFVEESGEKGPQASTVKVAHPRHPRRTVPLAIVKPAASKRAGDSR
jgi:cold shock CspA family protein/ribosome-associated translation inhibitor RaiA